MILGAFLKFDNPAKPIDFRVVERTFSPGAWLAADRYGPDKAESADT